MKTSSVSKLSSSGSGSFEAAWSEVGSDKWYCTSLLLLLSWRPKVAIFAVGIGQSVPVSSLYSAIWRIDINRHYTGGVSQTMYSHTWQDESFVTDRRELASSSSRSWSASLRQVVSYKSASSACPVWWWLPLRSLGLNFSLTFFSAFVFSTKHKNFTSNKGA